MKSHEILTVCLGLGMFVVMFLAPALMSARDNWLERREHKQRR